MSYRWLIDSHLLAGAHITLTLAALIAALNSGHML